MVWGGGRSRRFGSGKLSLERGFGSIGSVQSTFPVGGPLGVAGGGGVRFQGLSSVKFFFEGPGGGEGFGSMGSLRSLCFLFFLGGGEGGWFLRLGSVKGSVPQVLSGYRMVQ